MAWLSLRPACILLALALLACRGEPAVETAPNSPSAPADESAPVLAERPWVLERFADVQILRYEVPSFAELDLQRKQLVYYLYQAALAGRDITYDQKFAGNLAVRRTLEAILRGYAGDRETAEFVALHTYTKRVWFSNGIHHHDSGLELEPGFPRGWFEAAVRGLDPATLPLREGQTVDELLAELGKYIFDPTFASKRTNRDMGADPVADSANNFYGEGLTAAEVAAYYAGKIDESDATPISWGLNSKLVEQDGELIEQTWCAGGMYGSAIREIVKWLLRARSVAENDQQRAAIEKLIAYYNSGDLEKFDEYNIAWVADTKSRVDTINGFIEVYDDAIGMRGTWEALVWLVDADASRRIAAIAEQAQWFEDNSPVLSAHKKKHVVGVTAKVITVVIGGGDSGPYPGIGVNLPNSDWISIRHGSKSMNLGNIIDALDRAEQSNGLLEEFCWDAAELERAKQHGTLGYKLSTDMHEVIGHASGQLEPGIGMPAETLGSYASALEEARADLFALYYAIDPKLVEIGVAPSIEVGKAEYDAYIRDALLVQLARVELGQQLEESHMRNQALVARWAYEHGKADNVIEKRVRDGETYFVINDYEQLRALFGELLREIQRIRSQGDGAAGKALVETYGVKIDRELHEEVLRRYGALGIASYSGFVQPKLVPVMDGDLITDVRLEYVDDFTAQMLEYAERYSFLPTHNEFTGGEQSGGQR